MDLSDIQRQRNEQLIRELEAENRSSTPGEPPTLRKLHTQLAGERGNRRMIQAEFEDRMKHVECVKLPRLEYYVDGAGELHGTLRFDQQRERLACNQVALLVPLAEVSPDMMPTKELRAIVLERFRIAFANDRAAYKVLEVLKRRPALGDLIAKGRSGSPGGVGFAVRVEPWPV